MSEIIDTGNPVIRDAQTFEHSPDDLRMIESLKDEKDVLRMRLEMMAAEHAMLKKQEEELRKHFRSMEEKMNCDSRSRTEIMASFDRTRLELETARKENAMLKAELRFARQDRERKDGGLGISEVMEEMIENAEQMTYGLRALYGILRNDNSEDCKSSCADSEIRGE